MKRWLTPELFVLTALAAVTRFWHLFTPKAVVFDELHYKHFAGHYLNGTHYYDVHPPLGKLLYAAVARLLDVPASVMLGPDPVVGLRVLPAVFGTLMVPLAYLILRQLGAVRRVATLAAFAVLCENALIADSRFALLEPLLIGFGLIAISLYLAARRSSGNRRWLMLAFSAFAAGCAIAVKWTGASALGLIAVAWFFEERRTRVHRRAAIEGATLAGIPLVVYVATFAIHFALLPHAGVDDAVMSGRFRATLIGEPRYDPAVRMSLLAKISDLHRAMSVGNTSLERVIHPAASPWYTWPVMKHPIGMWQNDHPLNGWQENVILLGNPVIWWGGLVVLFLAGANLLRHRDRWRAHRFAIAFLAGGFLINFAPFIAIRRVMYLYHYLFALLMLILLASYSLGVLARWNADDAAPWQFTSRRSATGYYGLAALIVVAFAYFSPLTYGWSLSQAAYDARFWVLHPRP